MVRTERIVSKSLVTYATPSAEELLVCCRFEERDFPCAHADRKMK